MNTFIGYIFLGLSLSAPMGPINAAQMDKGLKHGFIHAWVLGLGAIAADIFYMMLVYFGVVHFLNTPFIQTFLWLFGFFVLTYTGVESLIGAHKVTSNEMRSSENLSKSFLSGLFMSLFNPLSILFWLGIYGSVLAKAASMYNLYDLLLYSSAIIIGILIWDITMASVASTFRHLLTDRVQKLISYSSGLSLIGFGCYFGIQACKVLFL
ncbi:LysE family transporter [Paenibacillus crassostreae]|uniref:Amino acid transporter n=1 Tax=Paenibacillus crassostreae TaxID=1763538 RepID=A0A162RGM3_9BACL|nr:LysE family transporter [Paenibacillus crassostreae]AOZ93564.1 amino acid transporter [Paenibacillus crassostreae]OAB71597.1 amino acid transporter [Paenibacillus crassostreae]